ncbi:MAG TPA: hypothetical protein VFB19_14240 [Mycobacterium sp.]|nr:hypothetical protein [Mycobacterium sp.]
MVKPERRTKADILAATAIVVVVAVGAVLIWWNSDARATVSHPAARPAPTISAARAVPATLKQLWTAPSTHTDEPVIVGNVVVTGDGHEVAGRDPKTGQPDWTYSRDLDLCGVTWVYDLAVAVYPDSRGCGQVSTIQARTGHRGPTRTAYADKQITLSTDGTTVLAAGRTRIEMWRSDMVRTLAYGDIDAPLNPPVPPKPPCQFLSTAASSSGASILETCKAFPDVRLTLLQVSKEDVKPEQKYLQPVGVAADSGAKVLAMSDLRTAVYLPTPKPRVVVYDETGQQVSSTELAKPATADIKVSHAGSLVTFWTGDSVGVLDGASLTFRYTIAAGSAKPLGPGQLMADRLLVPVTGGIAVYTPNDGTFERLIPVDRGNAAGPIVPGVIGTTVVEQRGNTVVALGAA